jgi:hypothetical protein
LLFSIILYPQQYLQKVRDGSIYRVVLGIGVIAAAVFQWIVLYFHLNTFLVIRGWKWYFHDKPWPIGIWPFVLVFVLAIAIVIFILKNPQRYKISLILLILLGYAIQVSFGFLEGAGFESIRVKYAGSVFDEYSWVAARDTDLGHSLLNFEQLYGYGGYLGTKPPGVYLVYELTQKAANLFYSNVTVVSSFIGSTTFSAYVFPLISFLVLIPLYLLSRFERSQPDSVLPGILYVAIPSVVLIPLFLDQVLDPLIFVAFLLLSGFLVKKQSIVLAFLAGFLINGIFYFSFSLLPAAPLVFAWVALDFLIERQKWKFSQLLKIILALLAGILLGFLVFRFGLNYDPILRYSKAMAEHRQIKDFQAGLQQIYYASVLNNAEFATWTGLPIILLFLSGLINSIRNVITKKSSELDSLLLSFVITYIALNIFGQTIGEVQRLWIFLMPVVCLYAVREARRLFNRRDIGLPLLLALQLITVLLTFTFQDFYGG